MPNYRRPRLKGGAVFFSVLLADGESDLLVRRIGQLRDAVRKTKRERSFDILAWVTLPDHLHCVLRMPLADSDYSSRWGTIKARFSMLQEPVRRRKSHVLRRERGLWQRRFWEHHIRDNVDLERHIRYCWFDPVRHGYVTRPHDWPYSSFHRDAGARNLVPDVLDLCEDGEFGERR